MLWKSWIRFLAASALFAGTLTVLFTRPVAADGRWGADYFPNIELTTQDGERVHFYDDLIKGKIVAINLIYTNCEYSCPLETARLAQVQKMLGERVGKDIFFYSISIDPVRDTPATLKAYAEKFHAGPGWIFLTGNKDEIDELSKKLGLYSDPSVNKDGHLPHLLIGNEASGQWLRDSATDNARFLTNLIGNFVDTWKNHDVAARSYADAAPMKIDDTGQYLFAKQCAACHTIGHGDKIGPDLQGVATARERGWLTRYISEPDKMLAAGDPIAKALSAKYKVPMPNLRLGQIDVNAIVNFLTTQNAASGKNTGAAKTEFEDTRQ
ncbi:MAG TPA: SCO family protein [Candidatus Solibacter sp.]|nr:SCO family protein [Candidatus Solibacter sp.]